MLRYGINIKQSIDNYLRIARVLASDRGRKGHDSVTQWRIRIGVFMHKQCAGIIAIIGSVASLILTDAVPAVTPGSAPDGAALSQSAVWTTRTITEFSPPSTYVPANGYESNTSSLSCDQLDDKAKLLLQQLGARDISFDDRNCRNKNANEIVTIDLTFSVLTPTGSVVMTAAGAAVPAHWRTIAMKGVDSNNCAFLYYVTRKVLPAFSTKNVKLIPKADCARMGVGLYAQMLVPAEEGSTAAH